MSIMTVTHTSAGRTKLIRLTSLGVAAATLPMTWARRVRQRRELAELLQQPHHMLSDVGLQRHDIVRERLKPFWIA